MTEIKLEKTIKLAFRGSQVDVHTLSIDIDRMAKTTVAMKLGSVFSDAMFTMQKKMPALDNVNSQKKNEEEIDPRSIGSVLVGFMSEENIIYIINTYCNLGCLYFENDLDLKNKNITEELDIKDIDYFIGYYFVNFTLKRYTA